MRKKKLTLRELDDDTLIEHWIQLHTQKQEFTRLRDNDGLYLIGVQIRLTEPEMKERGLFNVNVRKNERS